MSIQNKPLISVLMAVYQIGSHEELDMAVSSVLLQSFSNLELIICSDGANKETIRTINHWKEHDKRVIVIENERNLGAGIARNRAAHLAAGKYIAIMDADDAAAFNRLERQVTFLEKNPQIAFVGTRGTYFTEKPGDRTGCYWYVARPEPEDFLMTLPFVHASLLFRREAFFAIGGYRELKRVTRSEDYDLLLRLYAMGLRGANLPEPLYFIRMNEATLKRRKYKYRIWEFAVKLEGFIRLGLMPQGIAFALKPLIVGLIPQNILCKIKNRYYDDKP